MLIVHSILVGALALQSACAHLLDNPLRADPSSLLGTNLLGLGPTLNHAHSKADIISLPEISLPLVDDDEPPKGKVMAPSQPHAESPIRLPAMAIDTSNTGGRPLIKISTNQPRPQPEPAPVSDKPTPDSSKAAPSASPTPDQPASPTSANSDHGKDMPIQANKPVVDSPPPAHPEPGVGEAEPASPTNPEADAADHEVISTTTATSDATTTGVETDTASAAKIRSKLSSTRTVLVSPTHTARKYGDGPKISGAPDDHKPVLAFVLTLAVVYSLANTLQ
ncbi:hypothetical protein H4R33_006161 [Dimargaris cristalligena]|uniref:Uncharacterized protein n=1 Tax=Dimargaris cristalligena TaxID=215637 RepID=A0A4P9ZUD5_9FUNG|nr:hypothetical protein H4R33_006161 [Dimargaris cristalligena]RKP36481.1 hypothetical protein BJ085DRAFT_32263 [Dimargaris cristalligena]|eukprot:RKP36481.1 hypothetical protein BJ085DRAFT_32263 [Dimargaris cristalligena]